MPELFGDFSWRPEARNHKSTLAPWLIMPGCKFESQKVEQILSRQPYFCNCAALLDLPFASRWMVMAAPRLGDLDISSVAATSFNFRPDQAGCHLIVGSRPDIYGQLTVRSLRKICGNTQRGFRRKSVNLRSLSVMTRSFCIWYNSDANKFRFVDYFMLMFDNFSHVSP